MADEIKIEVIDDPVPVNQDDGRSILGISKAHDRAVDRAMTKMNVSIPKNEEEDRAAKEMYAEISEEYRQMIAEKVRNLPVIRYMRKEPFSMDEKRLIAAALMARTPLYKVAQTLRCSYHKIDNAIQADPFLKELAVERNIREREEVEEGLDDCVRARNPAVLMWKASKIIPEKYGDQVNLDNEDDTRLVIGAIPDEDIDEADALLEDMKDKVPEVPTSAVIQANEEAAELAACGGGVSSLPLADTPVTPAIRPPAGDPNFRPFVSAADTGRINDPILGSMNADGSPVVEEDAGPDNYGVFEGADDYGSGSWI